MFMFSACGVGVGVGLWLRLAFAFNLLNVEYSIDNINNSDAAHWPFGI